MAEQPKEPVDNTRRNVVLGSISAVAMGAVGGINYFAGTIVRDQKRRNLVPEYAEKLSGGVNKGDFNLVGSALLEAQRYGILNEVVNAMAPNTALAEEMPSASDAALDNDMRGRFHLKNLRSAVDKRNLMQAYTALSDARREQVLENMVNQINTLLAQDRPR